jgi:hypothetical protein
MRSQAQNAAMHAAAAGRSTLGIPKSVGQEFVAASHGTSLASLPRKVRKKVKTGFRQAVNGAHR